MAALKRAMEGDDAAEIRRLTEALTQASHKLASAMYQQSGHSAGQGASGGTGGSDYGESSGADADDIVDAEYREVA